MTRYTADPDTPTADGLKILARDRRLERFVTEQPPYSIMVRGIEVDILPTAQRHGNCPAQRLSADILDRIDEFVAPGVTVNPDDNSYGEAELTPTARRRNR